MKIQKYTNTVSPFAGISFVDHIFNKVGLSRLIDNELGSRVEYAGYSYNALNPQKSSTAKPNCILIFISTGFIIENAALPAGSKKLAHRNE